jgi:hypothetical protein
MKSLLIALALSSSLLQESLPAAAAPCEAEVAAAVNQPPGKFGRWVNRRTRPVGKALEKVTPFRLAKKSRAELRIGGCCFPADTHISLPGGATCTIEELRVGQAVLSWNPATDALDTVRVEALATVVHDSLRTLSFADSRTVTATADHPFWVKNVGWASLSPALTTARYAADTVRLLQPGDRCLVFNGTNQLIPTQLQKVTSLTTCGITTYTITRLSRGNLFFANGLAVGVEEDKRSNNRPSRHHRLQAAVVAPVAVSSYPTIRTGAGSR